MRRDLIAVALISAVAFALRVYPAWHSVFGTDGVNFLETDAWYHVRLVENQVRNFPFRVSLDPYAAPGGQFVPIAPLYDTLTSAAVVLWHGPNASTESIEHVASFIPPVLGTLAVVVTWLLGRHLFGRAAGLLGAALLTVLPGHFMDRTMLGFVDHHALEALLALTTLLAIAWGLRNPTTSVPDPTTGIPDAQAAKTGTEVDRGRRSLVAGIALGLYLLAWASGAFLVAILGVWLALLIPLARPTGELRDVGRLTAVTALVALVLVATFQDPRMHRYGTQIIGLVGLAIIALVMEVLGRRQLAPRRTNVVVLGLALIAVVFGLTVWWLNPGLVLQLSIDLRRLTPDPTRMGVLEARPLFLYPGELNWQQPWQFFRTGFYIGLIAIVLFAVRIWRDRRAADLLVWVFAVATFAATIGQNRFGYYLVPACALLGGWLAALILDWAQSARHHNGSRLVRAPGRLAREIASIMVVGAMFAPNLAPSALLTPRTGGLARYWQDTMLWLRNQTTPPFATAAAAGDEYYLARYPRAAVPSPDYTVMNWWDQGYWLIQRARRVPVANPTQERAPNAAGFYAETDEARAGELLHAERARFVVSDWELPFRLTPEGSVMGRFQSVLDWAGATHARYYEILYRKGPGRWMPVWVFHEAYYRAMAYRLTVLGGRAADPSNSTTVVTFADRRNASGFEFREMLTENTYATYAAALLAADASGPHAMIVGLDPWQTAFPLEALTLMTQVHSARTPEQKPSETPWVRVFEVRRTSPLPGGR